MDRAERMRMAICSPTFKWTSTGVLWDRARGEEGVVECHSEQCCRSWMQKEKLLGCGT